MVGISMSRNFATSGDSLHELGRAHPRDPGAHGGRDRDLPVVRGGGTVVGEEEEVKATKERIRHAIATELRRQADAPDEMPLWMDADTETDPVNIDGYVDFGLVTDAILNALKEAK